MQFFLKQKKPSRYDKNQGESDGRLVRSTEYD